MVELGGIELPLVGRVRPRGDGLGLQHLERHPVSRFRLHGAHQVLLERQFVDRHQRVGIARDLEGSRVVAAIEPETAARDGSQRIWITDSQMEDLMESELMKAGMMPDLTNPVVNLPNFVEQHLQAVFDEHAELDVDTLGEITEGFSGADVGAIVNTAVSLVLQEFLSRYPKPEEAKKHADEAIVTAEHFQDAVKKVRSSREGKPMEKVTVPYYR